MFPGDEETSLDGENEGDMSVKRQKCDGLQRFLPCAWGSSRILHRIEEKCSAGLVLKGGPQPGDVLGNSKTPLHWAKQVLVAVCILSSHVKSL